MFLFTLEFWFWTAVIFIGAIVILNVLGSDAFWNSLAVVLIFGVGAALTGGVIWLLLAMSLSEIITGAMAIGGFLVLAILMGLMRKRELENYQRKRTRTELLDAVTRRRVFAAQGLDDSANSVPAEHDFSEEEIAQNARKKWRYNLPR